MSIDEAAGAGAEVGVDDRGEANKVEEDLHGSRQDDVGKVDA